MISLKFISIGQPSVNLVGQQLNYSTEGLGSSDPQEDQHLSNYEAFPGNL